MSKDEKPEAKPTRLIEGYQPLEKGYKPDEGGLDSSNPPQGGSGVPSKPPSSGGSKK